MYPGIEVVKVCPDPTEYHVGETINYEWRVSNTGDVPLSSIVLTDTGGPCTPVYVSGDVNNNGKLDPGEVWIYKCSYVVQDGDTGFTNTATVAGTDSQGEKVDDTSNTCEVKIVYPEIEVVKVCPDPTEYHVGETIKYEWRVSNTGDVPLSSIVLTDTGGPCTPVYVSGDVNNNGKLDPGEVWIYKCSYVVQDGDTGFTNTATVAGTASQGEKVDDTSNTCEVKIVYPKIDIEKTGSPAIVAPGGNVTYTINYTNTGTVPLHDVVITENYPNGVTFISASPAPDAGTNNVWTIGNLSAGESGTIVIKVKVPEQIDLSFTETGSVIGEGLVMVTKDLSTEQKPYSLRNRVTLSCVTPSGKKLVVS